MSADAGGVPPVRRLHPTRVLVAGHDRRFLRVVGLLLRRRGLLVEYTQRIDGLVDLAERQRANVVVIDASPSLTVAVRAMAALEALTPSVRVVLVYEDESGIDQLRLLPKWGAFDELIDEVEDRHGSYSREVSRGVD